MQEDGELSESQDSDNSSQSPGTRSSRMRRATFPVDDEDVPSQGESSRESSPRSHSPSPSPRRTPDSPMRPPLPPARSVRSPLRPFEDLFEGQPQKADQPPLSGDLNGTQQKAAASPSGHADEQQPGDNRQYQSGSPKTVPERRKSVDDGFNSDPEQSSRAMRLQATHLSKSENSNMAGVPRPKGIRRVASEAQLLSKYAGRAGNGQKLGSFGSHTSDCTSSFDAYLRNHRSSSPSPKCRQGFLACAYTASVKCAPRDTFACACTASVLCFLCLFQFGCSGVIAVALNSMNRLHHTAIGAVSCRPALRYTLLGLLLH